MIPPNFTRPLYGVGEHNTKIFFFFFVNLDTVLWYSTQKFRQHLANQMKLNDINLVWNRANSLFEWIFSLLSSRNYHKLPWQRDVTTSPLCYVCLRKWLLNTQHQGPRGHLPCILVDTGISRTSTEWGKISLYSFKRVPLTKNRWRASFVARNKLNPAHFALCSALEQSRVFRLGGFDCLSQP